MPAGLNVRSPFGWMRGPSVISKDLPKRWASLIRRLLICTCGNVLPPTKNYPCSGKMHAPHKTDAANPIIWNSGNQERSFSFLPGKPPLYSCSCLLSTLNASNKSAKSGNTILVFWDASQGTATIYCSPSPHLPPQSALKPLLPSLLYSCCYVDKNGRPGYTCLSLQKSSLQ